MEFENYSDDLFDIDVAFEYYKVDSDQVAFWDSSKALEYAINEKESVSIVKKEIIFKEKSGRLYKQSINLWMVPNKNKREVTYYIIGDDIGEEPEIVCFYTWKNDDYDKVAESIVSNENFQKYYWNKLGLYKVKVTVNDDNKTIKTDYELLLEVDMKQGKRTK